MNSVVSKTLEALAEALGLDKSVAVEWQVRHEVNQRIVEVFKIQTMTVTELAKRAETSRAGITRILKGDTGDISLDVLFRVLGALGQKSENAVFESCVNETLLDECYQEKTKNQLAKSFNRVAGEKEFNN